MYTACPDYEPDTVQRIGYQVFLGGNTLRGNERLEVRGADPNPILSVFSLYIRHDKFRTGRK